MSRPPADQPETRWRPPGATGGQEVEGGAAQGAAYRVEEQGGTRGAAVVEEGAYQGRPVVLGVVDAEVGAQVTDARHLGRAAGQADGHGDRVPGVLDEERADAAGGRRDDRDVVGGQTGEASDAQGGAAGADHGDGLARVEPVGNRMQPVVGGHREFGVATGAVPKWATTRRPSQVGSVPGPRASTVPATSRPGTVGSSGSGTGPEDGRRGRAAAADRTLLPQVWLRSTPHRSGCLGSTSRRGARVFHRPGRLSVAWFTMGVQA